MPNVIADLSGTSSPWVVNAANDAGRAMVRSAIVERPAGHDPQAPGERGAYLDYTDSMGNAGIPSGSPSERAEHQAAAIGGYEVEQWYRWAEVFHELPDTTNLWGFYGQWHMSAGGTLAAAAFAAYSRRRWLLLSDGGRAWTPRELGPIVLGERVEWRVRFVWSTSTTRGRVTVIRNDVPVLDVQGVRTTGEARPPYPKWGVYRDAQVNGRVRYTRTGLKVWDADPGPFGGQAPTDTTGPEVRFEAPAAGEVLTRSGTVPAVVAATDPGGIADVRLFAAGPGSATPVQLWQETRAPFGDGDYPWPTLDQLPSGDVTLVAVARDRAGNESRVTRGVALRDAPPPTDPPDPTPTDPPTVDVDGLRAHLEGARLDLAAAIQLLG